jgi:quercetin dioxygenase-like cupin family protein
MTEGIRIPTSEELDRRIGRFADLRPMSTAAELEWTGQEAIDIIFARKLMPVILEDKKNPFGNVVPIFGAGGITMFVSILPPGQGPCLHSHNDTFETFMVLEGTIEYEIGEPVTHRRTLKKWDVMSVPPRIYRGFRNVGTSDAVQLTVISGPDDSRDDVSMPHSIAERVEGEHGRAVLEAFARVFKFDPKREPVA